MECCPVCSVARGDALCVCGYSFEGDMIVDWGRLKAQLASIPSSSWPTRVRLVHAANSVQLSKGGSGRQTATQLGVSPMTISRAVRLAKSLDFYPQLALCRNEDAAQRKLTSIANEIPTSHPNLPDAGPFELEANLQSYLAQHWDATSLGKEWKLYEKGHVDAGEIGIIDLLAQHRNRPGWLVIELKVRKTSDQVLGQVLRYMGWVRTRLAAKNDTIEGLVIASWPDIQTLYGLECLPDIRMMCYRRLPNGLDLYEKTLHEHLISSLDDDQRRKLVELIKNS